MNRKQATFGRCSTLASTLLLVLAVAVVYAQPVDLRVDGKRLNASLSQLRTIGLNENGGSDRVAYSQYNKDGLDYLSELMSESGLDSHIDVAGNLVGRRPGRLSGLAPIITGSHIDTVPNGGHYDGIVGSLAAIEVARTLHESGYVTDHPLEVIVWSNEEGGKTGSRSINGSVVPDEMNLQSLGDKSLGEGIAFIGGAPDRLLENKREPGSVAALLELHIEQGAILDRKDISIGVV
ncbi:MAG: M20/M25/M40 family metallo-hydrolase, partial [Woeseiaceae bacterium]